MFCEVYKSHPWRHGYSADIRPSDRGFSRLFGADYSSRGWAALIWALNPLNAHPTIKGNMEDTTTGEEAIEISSRTQLTHKKSSRYRGCPRIIVFIANPLQPIARLYIAARECTRKLFLYWLAVFWTSQSSPELEGWQNTYKAFLHKISRCWRRFWTESYTAYTGCSLIIVFFP